MSKQSIEEEIRALNINAEQATYYTPDELTLVRNPDSDIVRATIRNKLTILCLSARCLFPVSQPEKYIQLYGSKPDRTIGDMFGILTDMSKLSGESRHLLNDVIQASRTAPVIQKVNAVKDLFYAFYLEVETDQGPRNFFIGRPNEYIKRRDGGRCTITDMDGGRYEVENYAAMDSQSQRLLNAFL